MKERVQKNSQVETIDSVRVVFNRYLNIQAGPDSFMKDAFMWGKVTTGRLVELQCDVQTGILYLSIVLRRKAWWRVV